ncbi:SAF domain-containing protein [Gordonia soli]|uniref:SAF domain-containing protein n=1 Tax=Gordonia soli NBRC 108243 TaxID=1223545 RepID=M0QJG4_9ACTN|nr:SAF domain-containing protein [Gordonia soli]GAC68703.1 hypothetical protein GS4_17_00910 [Gordonia soli NBRC 108243]
MPLFSRDVLATRLIDRVRHALRPGWTRSVIVRRCAASVLVVAALAVALTSHRDTDDHEALAAARDLLPGQALAADDLVPIRVPTGLLPDGAIRMSSDAVGRTVVGRVRSGELITDTRLISGRLPAQLTGDRRARLVPVHIADETVASVLREGDLVDVVTEDSEIVARGAIVALNARPADSGALSGRVAAAPVLLAMDEAAAHRVAAAALRSSIAVVVH